MPELSLFFAVSLLDHIRHWFVGKDGSLTMLVFLGAAAVVALIVFAWAVMVRDQSRHPTLKPTQSSPLRCATTVLETIRWSKDHY